MIDSKLRNPVQPLFDKIAKQFVRLGVTANQVTVLAFVVGIAASISIGFKYMYLAVVLLWLSGTLDVVDGSIARMTGKSSPKGAYMDLIFDRMVEAFVVLGLYAAYPEHAWMYLIFFVAVLFNFTTFIVAGALFPNTGKKSMHYDIGIAERTETFIVFTLLLFLPQYIYYILLMFNVVILMTGVLRFYKVITYKE